MVSTRSRPPCAAGGISVNSIVGPARVFEDWQPIKETPRQSKRARVLPNSLRTRAGLTEDSAAVPILRELIHGEPRCPIAHQPSKLQGRSPRRVSGLLRSVAEFNWKNSKPIEQHQLGLRSDRDRAPILRWFTISLNIFLWRGTFLNRVCCRIAE